MKNEIEGALIFVFTIFVVMGITFVVIGFSDDVMFLAVGAIFAIFGGAALFSIMYRRYIQAQVMKTGIALFTDAVDVILENTQVNNVHAYRVRTQWLDRPSNTLYYFQSNYIKDNPAGKIKNMQKIKVMVNPKNYAQYYMDLPF